MYMQNIIHKMNKKCINIHNNHGIINMRNETPEICATRWESIW